jgi:hypothetical protein
MPQDTRDALFPHHAAYMHDPVAICTWLSRKACVDVAEAKRQIIIVTNCGAHGLTGEAGRFLDGFLRRQRST